MAAPAAAYLVAKRDDGFGDVYPLQRGVTYGVGRSPKNRIVLAGRSLLSRSCRGSLRGRRLVRPRSGQPERHPRQGQQCRGDRKLDTGDEVQFGRSKFLFVFDLAELPGLPESPARALEESVKITRRSNSSKYVPDPKREETFTDERDSSMCRSNVASSLSPGPRYGLGEDA